MPRHSSDAQPSHSHAVIAPTVNVRCARTSDAGSVAPLFDAYRQFYGATSDVAAARRFLLERLARNESVVFIASSVADGAAAGNGRERAAEVVGFAQVYPSFSSVAMRPVMVLNDLYVSPAWRRAHVARRLVGDVVGYASRLGAARVELSTQHTNSAALGLYTSLGFMADVAFSHLSLALPGA